MSIVAMHKKIRILRDPYEVPGIMYLNLTTPLNFVKVNKKSHLTCPALQILRKFYRYCHPYHIFSLRSLFWWFKVCYPNTKLIWQHLKTRVFSHQNHFIYFIWTRLLVTPNWHRNSRFEKLTDNFVKVRYPEGIIFNSI